MYFYEVEVKNRVVKGLGFKIHGTQGDWYEETLYFLADSEDEAKRLTEDYVKKRKIIGISARRTFFVHREVEIIDIKRIA